MTPGQTWALVGCVIMLAVWFHELRIPLWLNASIVMTFTVTAIAVVT